MKYKVTDISIWMDEFKFPGNPKLNISGPHNRVSGKNPEFVYDIELCSQSGTHIQGPHYFDGNGAKIDEFEIEDFCGDAYIVDVIKRGEDVTKEDLEEQISEIDLKGKIVIFRTGHMDELIKKKIIENNKRPGLSLEAAKYLCEDKKVKMIAIDSIGLESRITENYEVNVYLCSKNILILECINNLYDIKNKEIILEAFPLKIRGIEGTPCRAIIKEAIM